jgi:hypothetical protein
MPALVSSLESARREWSRILPELFPWELPLPWAPFTVRNATAVCPEPGDPARGSVCAKDAHASTSRGAGTSATARIRNASRRLSAGRRLAARRNVARTPASKPSMLRLKKSAVTAPRPRPRPLRTRTLRPRVVTQPKFFFAPLLRSARLLRTPRDLAPQPGSLLLRYLPPGRWQRPGPGTEVARTRHLGWPEEAGHRIPGRTSKPIPASADHRCRWAAAGTAAMTSPPQGAGRHLSRASGRLL